MKGFEPATQSKLLYIELVGEEKSGKTDFGMWAPETVAHLDLENRGGIIRSEIAERKILTKRYLTGDFVDVTMKSGLGSTLKDQCAKYLTEIDNDFKDACIDRDVRTIIMDGGSTYFRLCTIGLLGAMGLDADKGYWYGVRNQHIETLFTFARRHDKIVIWTHRTKELWAKSPDTGKRESTGEFTRDGYEKMGNVCDIGLFMRLDAIERVFKAKVMYSTANPLMWTGEELDLPTENSYAELMSLLTDTEQSEWQ